MYTEFAGRISNENPSEQRVETKSREPDTNTTRYHATGPNISPSNKPSNSDNSEHEYEDDILHHDLEGAAVSLEYEDPDSSLVQVCMCYEPNLAIYIASYTMILGYALYGS